MSDAKMERWEKAIDELRGRRDKVQAAIVELEAEAGELRPLQLGKRIDAAIKVEGHKRELVAVIDALDGARAELKMAQAENDERLKRIDQLVKLGTKQMVKVKRSFDLLAAETEKAIAIDNELRALGAYCPWEPVAPLASGIRMVKDAWRAYDFGQRHAREITERKKRHPPKPYVAPTIGFGKRGLPIYADTPERE